MSRADIPGYSEALAALEQAGCEPCVDSGDVALIVLTVATPVIMAAMLADMSDSIAAEQPEYLDSAQAIAAFLDTMSFHVRERTGQ